MTSLELWCFACITCTFGALMSYVIILIRMEFMRQYNKNVIRYFIMVKIMDIIIINRTTELKPATKLEPGVNKLELKRDINIEVDMFVFYYYCAYLCIKVFLFTCTAVGFGLFNLVYWAMH